ncbi:hypothetical protein ACQP2F_01635 [Actinoplanes sp. CA-030573]|uniref:hypothetical protein n=1 Tax=Actinoplanes sp. CA-030573 TaxID=3239898 RepID=UPI003D9504E2
MLPAPVPAVKRRPLPRPHHADPGRQLPFFGAETTEPSPADLAGLLAGPGRLGRMGGTARVSVEVDAAWRVHVLVAELVIRGLTVQWRPLHDQDQEQPVRPEPAEIEPAGDPFDDVYPDPDEWPDSSAADEPSGGDLVEDGRRDHQDPGAGRLLPVPGELSLTAGRRPPDTERALNKETEGDEPSDKPAEPERRPRFEVLTAYSSRLNALARAWPEATAQLFLSGPRLRLWVAAAGEPVAGGYALGLDPHKDLVAIDAALVRAGLAGRASDDGRHYLIVGKRRLRRLAELVGERPGAAPEEGWPGGAGA